MPRLVLRPMPQPADGVCVGTLDGEPVTFHGRTATAGGREHEAKAIAPDILEAVDVAARDVFGPEWVQALALVTGLNPRTCQRDRIGRYGLPAPILRALGEAAAEPWPRVTGDMMLACARLLKTNDIRNSSGLRPRHPAFAGPPVGGDVDATMYVIAQQARALVYRLVAERSEHRAPALDGEA
ncbi:MULTISPECIES: hypothetical protein [unclassified Methylobacterium]|uniref:hypothetical protein n=1 Tax=unclassified Methylobacterium TaxID=2615210 RepID=UPI0006893B7E|nr:MULTISPECIES: hypothetical protein [unclassified Methylobacterium]SFU94245.1 hypothetical protein SAMN02799643_03314 [Methylobacterium sp. UNCCL125]